jgi:hypothetical protein
MTITYRPSALGHLVFNAAHKIGGFAQFVLSFLRSPHQLVRSWPESGITLGPRVAVFIHYDRQGVVRPYVQRYVTILQQCGFSVVFVTNSERLQEASLAALQPFCTGILIRRNVGYDFGAIREALEVLELPRKNTESVLFVNDSVYGPLRPLSQILERIDFDKADLWGATESWQVCYHLQSHFLMAGRKVLCSDGWRKFWKRVRSVQSKEWVTRHYEAGLTQAVLRNGLVCNAIWRYAELIRDVDPSLLGGDDAQALRDPRVAARRKHARRIIDAGVSRRPLNPTSDLWRQLLRSGYPFLKRQLLCETLDGVFDIEDWREEIAKTTGTSTETIDADLKEVLYDRVP